MSSLGNSFKTIFKESVRFYSTKTIRNSSKLSWNVNGHNPKGRQIPKNKVINDPKYSVKNDPKYMVGPPNSGKFAGLKAIDSESRIKNETFVKKIETFEALKIDETIRNSILNQALGHLEYKKPTSIQILATKAIQAKRKSPDEFKSFLLAAETGSGKTLAYLAPILSKLKEQELNDPDWIHIKDLPIVRTLILVPTLELVSQVLTTVKKISHEAKLSSLALSASVSSKSSLDRRIDVLITTPDKFIKTFKSANQLKGHFKYCKHIIVDEADTLMDKSFVESTQMVLSSASPSVTDLIFCSATIPKSFDRVLHDLYPETLRIVSPSLHRIPRSIDFKVVEVFNPPYLNSKPLALQQALYAISSDNTEPGNVKRVVVFLNRKDDIPALAELLIEKGYETIHTSGSIGLEERRNIISQFVNPAPLLEDNKAKVRVLLTTDLLARGIDMNNIRNVILYDIPHSSIDLIHRTGRTGRMGKRGRVFLFVDKKESKAWVKGLEKVIRKGMLLA